YASLRRTASWCPATGRAAAKCDSEFRSTNHRLDEAKNFIAQTKSPVGRAVVAGVGSIERFDVRRLKPLGAGRRVEGHLLVFAHALVAVAFNRGKVRKQILAARVGGDEAEPLGVAEPFHCTCTHVCCSRELRTTDDRPDAGTSRRETRPEEYRPGGLRHTSTFH